MNTPAPKRRARRIAADEAHAWARNLRLGKNWAAKYVLCMTTLYVNGEGVCFVSIPQLAEDCELSPQTIRSRLAWLDSIGAVGRRAQWVDETGRRNGEGKGRRTSDEIVLLLDADPDEIEAKANGLDPMAQTGSEASRPCADPTVGHPVSPTTGAPLTPQVCIGAESSEPEPEQEPQQESPPTPPSGGSVDDDGFKDFEKEWPEPIVKHALAREVWKGLTPADRETVKKAARGYGAWRRGQRKPPNVVSAHSFLRDRGTWDQFTGVAPAGVDVPMQHLAPGSTEAKAVTVAYDIAGALSAVRGFMRAQDGGIYYRREVNPGLLALADAPMREQWPELTIQQAGAWNGFLEKTVTVQTWHRLRENDRAPWLWPPSKEGKIYTATAPPENLMTPEDEAYLATKSIG